MLLQCVSYIPNCFDIFGLFQSTILTENYSTKLNFYPFILFIYPFTESLHDTMQLLYDLWWGIQFSKKSEGIFPNLVRETLECYYQKSLVTHVSYLPCLRFKIWLVQVLLQDLIEEECWEISNLIISIENIYPYMNFYIFFFFGVKSGFNAAGKQKSKT